VAAFIDICRMQRQQKGSRPNQSELEDKCPAFTSTAGTTVRHSQWLCASQQNSLPDVRFRRASAQCPLYPRKRTFVDRVGMSAMCQKRTSRAAVETGDYSITSSASTRRLCGTSIPRALAVLRLITSSNFVGSSTGMSRGLAPRRILSTSSAVRRNRPG